MAPGSGLIGNYLEGISLIGDWRKYVGLLVAALCKRVVYLVEESHILVGPFQKDDDVCGVLLIFYLFVNEPLKADFGSVVIEVVLEDPCMVLFLEPLDEEPVCYSLEHL